MPGAEFAGISITLGGGNRSFVTVAANDDIVLRTDEIEYRLGVGPCVDAVVHQTTFRRAISAMTAAGRSSGDAQRD